MRKTTDADRTEERSRRPTVVGLLMLDAESYPPGTSPTLDFVGQTDTVLLGRHVEGCTVERLIYQGDPNLEGAMISAARDLVASGAEMITGDCGFMVRHQSAVRNAISTPVFLSSLILVPLLLATLAEDTKLAVITASAESLTPDVLRLSGVSNLDRLIIGDMTGQPFFDAAMMQCVAEVDTYAIEKETVAVVERLVARNPDVGAILLECTGLPPFAAAVQSHTGLPVYDSVRAVDLMASGLMPPVGQRLH